MAVKQLKQHDARNDIRFLREIAILKECRSGHVVQFLVSLLDFTRLSALVPHHREGRVKVAHIALWRNGKDGANMQWPALCRAPAWRLAAPCWCAS